MDRHPWIRSLILLGIVATLAINLGRLWLADSLEPFAAGRFLAPAGSSTSPGSGVRIFDYRPGGSLVYRFGLVNSGPVTVRVTGIEGYPEDGAVLAVPGRVEVCRRGWTDCRPMRELSLASGEERLMRIHARFANCQRYPPGSVGRVDTFLVHFEVTGLPATASLTLNDSAVVAAPEECPGMTGGAPDARSPGRARR